MSFSATRGHSCCHSCHYAKCSTDTGRLKQSCTGRFIVKGNIDAAGSHMAGVQFLMPSEVLLMRYADTCREERERYLPRVIYRKAVCFQAHISQREISISDADVFPVTTNLPVLFPPPHAGAWKKGILGLPPRCALRHAP